MAQVCDCYLQAPARYAAGTHTVSVDEMTGIQALERLHPTHPMKPGQPEHREFEYVRHGTQCLIANLEISTGHLPTPTVGARRTEQDFAEHIQRTVATDPQAGWIIVADNLNTHNSETLVRWVAPACGLEVELGVKGKHGILKTRHSRAEFLSDPAHRIRFAYVPKHTSWLNQIEIWFSILMRRVLRRGNFCSREELREKILSFIDYFNSNSRSLSRDASYLAQPNVQPLEVNDCSAIPGLRFIP